ncbi:MAG: peptidylprolyl isomerase [Bacteroidota bacterium]
MRSQIMLLFLSLFCFLNLSAQKNDPVLFSVEGIPVHKSEFEYIYTKTNGPNASFSKESLDEYLNLYVNFKLKVQKAKEMKLDTIVSLQQELNGYRRQLADSYLIDREVTEKLVEEAYLRTKQDVNISHVLVKLAPNALPSDTLKAYNKVMEAKKELDKNQDFEVVAKKYSEDKSVSKNNGHIGWVTALFPNGFYHLETAAYTAEIGKPVGPIRTTGGYHVIVVNERRQAQGEVEVAHILVRLDKNPDLIKARKKIDEAYNKLQSDSTDFKEIAKEYSDDKLTAKKGGYLGFFGINRYEKPFEEAAFALKNDEEYTKPVQTSIGWHIIKRLNKKEDQSLQQMKSSLQNKIKADKRFELAKAAMVKRIKKEGNFQEQRTTLESFVSTLQKDTSKTFLTYKWKAPKEPSNDVLFGFGESQQTSLGDFEKYLQGSSRIRQQKSRQGISAVVEFLYDQYVSENALKYEEKQLETKYPEFKSLMREYEEGVLLFEVTKMQVWDKASQDSAGLRKFYDENMKEYMWENRAVISEFTLMESAKEKINQIREFSRQNPPESVTGSFNGVGPVQILSYKSKKYEKGRNDILDKMEWKAGELSPVQINKKNKSYEYFKIEEILPPSQKTLKEARGYVVADYQDYLEAKWLEQLKKEYKVDINQKVFNKMVKK